MEDYKIPDGEDESRKYLLILQDNQPKLQDYIVLDGLKYWLDKNYINNKITMYQYPKDQQFQVKNLVYHTNSFKLLLNKILLTDNDIYESINRILEYNLQTYDLLYNKLKEMNWKSTKDYLRLRPYLLTNIDINKIFQLYKEFNLVDPAFMNKFYSLKIPIDNRDLMTDYFGYRKAWYYLYYINLDDLIPTLKYILDKGDCSYTGLIDYILWLKGIDKESNQYEESMTYYDNYFYENNDYNVVYNLLSELVPEKQKRTNQIYEYLSK